MAVLVSSRSLFCTRYMVASEAQCQPIRGLESGLQLGGHRSTLHPADRCSWLSIPVPPRQNSACTRRTTIATAESRAPFVGRPLPQKLKGTVSAKDVLALLASTRATVGRTLDEVGIAALRPEEWMALFRELERGRMPWKALEVFRWMQQQRGYKPDNGLYAKLIALMGKSGKLMPAVRLFLEMRKVGCLPDTSNYNALIQAYGHNGRGDQVLELFEEMKHRQGCEPNVVTFNSIVTATPVSSNIEVVDSVLPTMKAASLSPDIITFNSLLNYYGRSGLFERMEETYMELTRSRVRPDVVTYNTMLYAYGTFGLCARMEDIFREMRHRRRRPNSRTFNALIRGYARAGQVDLMDAAFRHMPRSGCEPNVVTHTLRIHGYARAHDIASAERAMRQAFACSPPPNAATYTELMAAYGGVGDMGAMWDVYTHMRSTGTAATAGVFATLLEVCGERGDMEGVKAVLHEMRSAKVRSTDDVRIAIVGAYATVGYFDGANAVLDPNGRKPLTGEPRSKAVAAFVRGCSLAGDMERVGQTLAALEQAGPSRLDYLLAYGAAVEGYAHRDMIGEMEATYNNMPPTCWPAPTMYEAMAAAYERAGEKESASDLLERMAGRGCLHKLLVAPSVEDQYSLAPEER